MSLRAVDARFLLPRQASRATVLGDLPAWRAGLVDAGMTLLDGVLDGAEPELVVAPGGLATSALRLSPKMAILEGRVPRRVLNGKHTHVERYLALPNTAVAEVLVSLQPATPVRYALQCWRVPSDRLRWWRNRVAASMVGRGVPAYPSSRLLTIVSSTPGPPYPLRGVRGPFNGIMAVLGPPNAAGRIGMLLFSPGMATPDRVVKFGRTSGVHDNDADELALGKVAGAGPAIADHAPRLVGRLRSDEFDAIVETAAAGTRLTDILRGPHRRATKMRHIENVGNWLVDIARATERSPDALTDERARAALEIRRFWTSVGAPVDLVERLPPVPAVIRHGDLWTDNVIVNQKRFTVIDWAEASMTGFPLSDLIYFLADSLGRVDGVSGKPSADRHFVKLFEGSGASSQFAFGLVRRMVDELRIPSESVGTLAALGFMGIARAGRTADEPPEITNTYAPGVVHPAERLTSLWFASPTLGASWKAWQ